MHPCDVPDCLALADGSKRYCALHAKARTAKELRLCADSEGHGAKSCLSCRRRFKGTDFVVMRPKPRAHVKKHQVQFGYHHVACEPPTTRLSKKKIRESEKPLFAAEL